MILIEGIRLVLAAINPADLQYIWNLLDVFLTSPKTWRQ